MPWDALLVLGFILNLYIGLCHTCNSDKMVDHVLHSYISIIDSIHGFRKHFVYDSELWEGRGPDLGKIHTFSRFFESVPFDMYSETDFGSEKSIGSIIFRLKLKHESMYFWTAG